MLCLDERTPGYYAVIPASVRYDDQISANAKLLYGEISALIGGEGFCYASNAHFAELYRVSERTITGWIGALKKGGYITVELERDAAGQVTSRKLYLTASAIDGQPLEKIFYTPRKNFQEGIENNFQYTNTSANNTPQSPPEGGGPPSKRRGRSSQYKAQPDVLPERFEKFWAFYRKHIPTDSNAGNRQKAIRAWDKLAPSDKLVTTMATALAVQVKTQTWISGIGVPHASTWLNNHGWEDDWGPMAESKPDSVESLNSEEAAEWVL